MSEVAEVKANQESEALFSKKRKKLLTDPLNDDNPVTVQVLGICSSLAVTVQLKPTIIMALAVAAVVAFSNLFYSMMRNLVPSRIRIIVQLAVVSVFVILVDQILQAFSYEVSKMLSVFVGLIITNCIVMGRLEAYAQSNKPYDSFLDGLGNGFGYAWVIILVALVRELLGSGTWTLPFLGKVEILTWFTENTSYMNNGLMVSPIGAFMVLAIIIWVQRTKSGYVEK